MDTAHFQKVELLGKYYLYLQTNDSSTANLERTGRPHTGVNNFGFRVIFWPEWTHPRVLAPTEAQLQALDVSAAETFWKQVRNRDMVSKDKYARLFVRLIMRIESKTRAEAEAIVRNFLDNE